MKKKKTEPLPKVEMSDAAELPEGWVESPLKELLIHVLGGEWGIDDNEIPPSGMERVSIIRGTDFQFFNEKKKLKTPTRLIKTASLGKRRLLSGDIIVEISGGAPDQPVGRTVLIDKKILEMAKNPLVCSNFCRQIRIHPHQDPKFVNLSLIYQYHNGKFDRFQTQSTNIRNLNFNEFSEEIIIPLPPLAEQQRIVARVEALLTHVNAARERLNRLPLIMKKFRQAVLAAACSGRLTEGWRGEQKELESSSALYNRIQSIRMEKYEQAVVEAKKLKKRLPSKPSFLENREPDSCETAEIPDEWIWKKVVNLGPYGEDTVKTGPFGAILKSKEFVSSGVPIIAIGNVQWGKFDLDCARVDHVTEEKASELENYRVRTGDVLFTRSGTIGRSLVVPDFADHWLMSYHLLRVRADPDLIIPQYLYFVFAGCESSKEYTSDATIGSTRPGINTTILENLPVPLPPLAEQHEIVRRVGMLFERTDQIEQQVVAATTRTEALTQAVLGKAFGGKL